MQNMQTHIAIKPSPVYANELNGIAGRYNRLLIDVFYQKQR